MRDSTLLYSSQEASLPLPPILPLMRKWGPSLPTILDIHHNPSHEHLYEKEAHEAAMKVARDPVLLRDEGGKELVWEMASSVFFKRAVRGKNAEGLGLGLGRYVLEMPTVWLAGVVSEEWGKKVGVGKGIGKGVGSR